MAALKPTDEQQKIIDESSRCVVIAKPGSGKTFTLSCKIKAILPALPHYKGVIAISFTNKASNELERRCLSTGIGRKSSFFGTIDKFFLTEIVIPFGTHVFGMPEREVEVVKIDEVKEVENTAKMQSLLDAGAYETLMGEYSPLLRQLYLQGQIVLEAFGFLASYVFDHSLACRRYLKARYSHVIIDEYQDCGLWQHILFVKLVDLGLCGVAVGDLDQSIFAFAKKDRKYLAALARDDARFLTFPLSENHRCHRSIVNYATRLLSPRSELLSTDDIRVYRKRVVGSESEIARWLTKAIPRFASRFQVAEVNRVGILFRGRRTGNLVHRSLDVPHKPVVTTPLDTESSLWGALFRRILNVAFSREVTKYELAEQYLSVDLHAKKVRAVMGLLRRIVELAETDLSQLHKHVDLFLSVAQITLPRSENRSAVTSLRAVLASMTLLDSFVPPSSDEVQLMTLHKAKGLEFDIVFHLDLYRFILPQYKCTLDEYIQYSNLHYVGITRAKKCTVLCTSTQRHNSRGELRSAEDSEFLHMNGLRSLRVRCPF